MEKFKEGKTLNEVNAFMKVAEIGGVPAPTVIDFDSSTKNSFDCEYILMDRLPGKPLGKEIDKLSSEQITKIMEQLVQIFQGMWAKRFNRYGSLDKNWKVGPMNEWKRAIFGQD